MYVIRVIALLELVILFSACKDDLIPSFRLKYQDREVVVEDTFRIAIIGNSITIHQPLPEAGWYDNWGMAASAPENDFVHQLYSRIKTHEKIMGRCSIKYDSRAAFEARYIEYDPVMIEKQFGDFKKFKPHLLIFRWGDNVDDSLAVINNFQKKFTELIQYFESNSSKKPMIIISAPWYPRHNVNSQFKKICNEYSIPYVDIVELRWLPGLSAEGKFSNGGVASHPSDQGMKVIADSLYDTFERMIPADRPVKK